MTAPAPPPRPPAPAAAGGGSPAIAIARRTTALLAAGLAGLAAISLALSLRAARLEHRDLARTAAAAIFEQTVAMRRWNAAHGGVYVPVTPELQPNPHLDDPRRDLVSTDGQRLTKVNPAYMTRLVAAELGRGTGVGLHLTSLRPLRPQNGPDAWERAALEAFEGGAREATAVSPGPSGPLFRLIRPLTVEEACLQCHAEQGYRVGDVRGGLAVTLPYGPYAAAFGREAVRIVVGHLLLLGAALAMALLLGRRIVAGIRAQEEALGRIRRLEGLLPLCAGCKRVRRPGADPRLPESWEPIEVYLRDRADAAVTHGMCPACAREYFGDYAR